MSNISKSQMRLAFILAGIVLLVCLILLALLNFSLFFIALIILVIGICLLRIKKPELFDYFSNKNDSLTDNEKTEHPPEQFTARIILLYTDGLNTRQVIVNKADFKIGRDPGSDFVLSGNTNISREHVQIHYDFGNKTTSIIDKSTHGTKLNGSSLPPGVPHTLHSGDIIQIEDRILTVQSKNY